MNSACEYGEERLAALLYEDGDRDEIIEMRAHLAECPGCRDELEGLASMRDLLSAWPDVVNAPRMVYVNEPGGLVARLRRWVAGVGRLHVGALLKPAAAAAAVVLVVAASVAVFEVRVAPDGRVQIGLAGSAGREQASGSTAGADEASAPVTREELQEGLVQAVSYMEELLRTRDEEERRLLVAAIDQRMQEQGMATSERLEGFVDAALTDMERQHDGDLGLVFSAIDELGVVTGTELQRMNAILASLMPREPEQEE